MTDYTTAGDCCCQVCGDEPCQCRDCADCGAAGYTDMFQRIGDDYFCDDCHDRRFASEIALLANRMRKVIRP